MTEPWIGSRLDGYWTQIEAYLKEHSDADFSHSLCPDCARKYYPDFDLDEKDAG